MSCLVLNGSALIGFEVVISNNSIHSPASVSAVIMVPSLIFVALQHRPPEVTAFVGGSSGQFSFGMSYTVVALPLTVILNVCFHQIGEFSHGDLLLVPTHVPSGRRCS